MRFSSLIFSLFLGLFSYSAFANPCADSFPSIAAARWGELVKASAEAQHHDRSEQGPAFEISERRKLSLDPVLVAIRKKASSEKTPLPALLDFTHGRVLDLKGDGPDLNLLAWLLHLGIWNEFLDSIGVYKVRVHFSGLSEVTKKNVWVDIFPSLITDGRSSGKTLSFFHHSSESPPESVEVGTLHLSDSHDFTAFVDEIFKSPKSYKRFYARQKITQLLGFPLEAVMIHDGTSRSDPDDFANILLGYLGYKFNPQASQDESFYTYYPDLRTVENDPIIGKQIFAALRSLKKLNLAFFHPLAAPKDSLKIQNAHEIKKLSLLLAKNAELPNPLAALDPLAAVPVSLARNPSPLKVYPIFQFIFDEILERLRFRYEPGLEVYLKR